MRVSFLLILVLFAAVPVQTQTSAPDTTPRGNVDNGRKIYRTYGCWQCHGTAAQGGTAGPRLAPRPIAWTVFSRYVRRPTQQMIPYTPKMVTDQELADIYAFLQTIPVPPPVSSIPQLKP
jgi:mono/diheme cytochrome c family protein